MNFLSILLVEIPVKSFMESTRDWIPFYGAIAITLLAALGNWWKSRSKTKHDQFQIFMDESAEFREEMRKDKRELQKENENLEIEKSTLKKQIMDYVNQLEDSAVKMKKAGEELLKTQNDLEQAQQKLIVLKGQEIELQNSKHLK